MGPESIFNKVKEILSGIFYIKAIYDGDRPSNFRGSFPNITLEIVSNTTEEVEENNQRINLFRMMIAGAILVDDFNKQIVGDESFKGILDVERDIKSALFSFYPDLEGNCLYFSLSTVSYSTLESGNGRVIFIQADFYYRES